MANYYSSCRTNYFKVKDNDAFKKALESIPDIEVDMDETRGWVILGNNPDGAGWPTHIYHEETDEETEIWLPEVVAEHLVNDEWAVFQEVGSEKLRYLVGHTTAINNQCETITISINDVYDMLKERGFDSVSRAEY